MSNSKVDGIDIEEIEENQIILMSEAPTPQSGYGLVFSTELATEIAEFTETDLFKKLKRNYALQKKDIIARSALNNAHDVAWLHYYKGMAAIVDLFFKDMEAVAKALKKDDEDDTDDSDKE